MNHIKSLHIEGFKKFAQLDVLFNEYMNILVGENEAGKSTLLEAIKIVINQQYRNVDKSFIKELFNVEMIHHFEESPSIQTLPYILIEMHMELDYKEKSSEYFYGEVNRSEIEAFGITFECKFDEELGSGLEKEIHEGEIPYEYYNLRWTTFAGHPYKMVKRPLNFLVIDTSNNDPNNAFNYFNRTLFQSIYSDRTRMSAKNTFRNLLVKVFDEISLPDIDEKRKFGINDKKMILETVLSVYENSVTLENRGSGMESLIKTQIALNRKKSHLDVILLEEPENHLSYSNLQKMLTEISSRQNESQIIVTTHSNMITSRLNLKNVLWITTNKVQLLQNIDKEVADFFVKADNNGFLQLLLSEKVLLVEGATEFLLLPQIYKQILGRTLEQDKVGVISCNGISYKNYLEVARTTNKKVAVITDNDKTQAKIDEAAMFNKNCDTQHIFLSNKLDEWTWEVCFYNLNKELLNSLISVKKDAKYLFHNVEYEPVLGKMLNNKVETSYMMLKSGIDFEIPKYIKDAILWLNK